MDEKEVLQDALLIVKKKGWTQGAYRADDGRVCLVGALREAAFGDALKTYTYPPSAATQRINVFNKARRRISDIIGHASIVGWNDSFGRTKEQVLDVLRKALFGAENE